MKVFPVGYSSPGARASIESLLQDEHTMLVDIRYSVASKRKPEWSGKALREQYGNRYLWIQELGNVNYYNDKPIQLCDPTIGIMRLLRGLGRGYNLILLCTCTSYDTCHRKTVIDLLLKALPDVEVVQPQTGIEPDSILCLSVKQPYATWLSNPAQFIKYDIPPKTIENRAWNTKYRGPLLIHASMTFEEGDPIDRWSWDFGRLVQAFPVMEDAYVRGAIVGVADLVDVVQQSSNDWFVGPYGFVLANARPIEPIPYKGALKLFGVPKSIIEENTNVMVK